VKDAVASDRLVCERLPDIKMITKADINTEEFNARFSRLLHRFIARELVNDPEMIQRARDYLTSQREKAREDWYWWRDEWMEILNRPVSQLRRDITKDNDKWDQMRSVSPLSMVHRLDFANLQWRRRAIKKVRDGLLLVKNSQYEGMSLGPYRGHKDDPRSDALDEEMVFDRFCLMAHRVVARLLAYDSEIANRYRQRLIEMFNGGMVDERRLIERWLEVLDRPTESIRRDITRRDDDWYGLRRVSGLLEYLSPRMDRRQLAKMWRLARVGLMARRRENSNDRRVEEDGTSNSCRRKTI